MEAAWKCAHDGTGRRTIKDMLHKTKTDKERKIVILQEKYGNPWNIKKKMHDLQQKKYAKKIKKDKLVILPIEKKKINGNME